MPLATYVNAGAELELARQVATNVIENRIYADRGLPASVEQASERLREARAEAAQLFDQPGNGVDMRSGLAVHDRSLAGALEEIVPDRLTEFRKAANGNQTQTSDAAMDWLTIF